MFLIVLIFAFPPPPPPFRDRSGFLYLKALVQGALLLLFFSFTSSVAYVCVCVQKRRSKEGREGMSTNRDPSTAAADLK